MAGRGEGVEASGRLSAYLLYFFLRLGLGIDCCRPFHRVVSCFMIFFSSRGEEPAPGYWRTCGLFEQCPVVFRPDC